jgi:hypothetical protein
MLDKRVLKAASSVGFSCEDVNSNRAPVNGRPPELLLCDKLIVKFEQVDMIDGPTTVNFGIGTLSG